jgi:heat-inducible transcriptional repressor
MLDDRKASILRAVVQEYIETAQPVGSGRVSAAPGVDVSSATVRNEMAVLEAEGYLAQPHTSAGRIPTEKGYRYFVDTIGAPGALRWCGAGPGSPRPRARPSRCARWPS